MADLGPQPDDSTQSFVVRTWQEPPGNLRGTIRHVQSQAQHGFTKLSQAQDFIEQKLARSSKISALPAQPTAHSTRSSRVHRRQWILVAAGLVIVIAAGLTVIASVNLPSKEILGSAVGSSLPIEVFLSLIIGLVLGSLGSIIWLRRSK